MKQVTKRALSLLMIVALLTGFAVPVSATSAQESQTTIRAVLMTLAVSLS